MGADMGVNTVSILLGWTRQQWHAAFADQGLTFSPTLMKQAVVEAYGGRGTEALDVLADVQAAWELRHVYDPLQSPIVLADTYRARAKC